MPPRKLFLLLAAFFLLAGMGGGGAQAPGAQLKPEIRLKIYNDAIRHYEKAQALYGEGKKEEALHELRKATNTVRAFPEAYQFARKICLELGKSKEADEQEGYFDFFGGIKERLFSGCVMKRPGSSKGESKSPVLRTFRKNPRLKF